MILLKELQQKEPDGEPELPEVEAETGFVPSLPIETSDETENALQSAIEMTPKAPIPPGSGTPEAALPQVPPSYRCTVTPRP